MKTNFFRCSYLLIIFLGLICFGQRSYGQYTTDSAKITLLTVSPGDEIYSYFGHTAIRVVDSRHGFDAVYGYGTFDFDTPHFYEKFVFGHLLYTMSIIPYAIFMQEYQSTGQAVYEQVLNLTSKEKWTLVKNLQDNYRPENRYYRYDFLYDNCSTRIRDIIEKSMDGKVVYDSSFIKKQVTFRGLLSNALQDEPWVSLGINTMLGIGSDKIAPLKDYMFLPGLMMNIYTNTKVYTGVNERNLAGEPTTILSASLIATKTGFFSTPEFGFSIFFIAVLLFSYWEFREKKHARWFDITLFSITGLLGLLFLIIWIGSLHKVMACNMNILWANPLNLAVVFSLVFRRFPASNSLLFWDILTGVFIAYIPISVIVSHHVFLVPVFMDLLIILRLWKMRLFLKS